MASFSLSLTTPFGAVVWALVAIAIAALARRYRDKLTPLLRHLLLRLPRRLIPMLARLSYRFYPSWRSFASGSERKRNAIDARIRQLKLVPGMPLILVGGIYLDVWLTPVSIRIARNSEYADLDTIKVSPGGSAFHVGQHLWEGFRRSTYLFSRIGKGDLFSKELETLAKDTPWIRGDYISSSKRSQCGVSVHLVDRDGIFVPTFTHRGSLRELSWRLILRDLQHRTRRGGGLLYLSGFFRTGLDVDLTSSIQALSPGVLVVLDHGRFQPDDSPVAIRSLLDAFRAGAIDIYLCTYAEIAALSRGAGHPISPDISAIELIEQLAKSKLLPKVTIMRGDPEPGQPAAILATDEKVELIEDGPEDWIPKNLPGGNSAFNAGLLDYFYSQEMHGDLRSYLADAVRAGLKFWARRA